MRNSFNAQIIKDLIYRQKEVNMKCQFSVASIAGLALGLAGEVGELASIIALKEGLKKPKPNDLYKFGGWQKIEENRFVCSQSLSCDFEKAFKHEMTQKAILGAIADELADVLVYLLQFCIAKNWQPEDLKKIDDILLQDVNLLIYKTGLIALSESQKSIQICIRLLQNIADYYQINLQTAYTAKTDKLILRHNLK